MFVETMERIRELLQESISTWSVAKDAGYFQSVVSRMRSKYKQNGEDCKGEMCTTKERQMGVDNVCVRNRLKEMGFT